MGLSECVQKDFTMCKVQPHCRNECEILRYFELATKNNLAIFNVDCKVDLIENVFN